MGLDEQTEEREVLDSIFPDEIVGRHVSIGTLLAGGLADSGVCYRCFG